MLRPVLRARWQAQHDSCAAVLWEFRADLAPVQLNDLAPI